VLPDAQSVLQENDIVHLLMRRDESATVERIVTAAPEVKA
jgi:trk system potassium uptake protein TrkA